MLPNPRPAARLLVLMAPVLPAKIRLSPTAGTPVRELVSSQFAAVPHRASGVAAPVHVQTSARADPIRPQRVTLVRPTEAKTLNTFRRVPGVRVFMAYNLRFEDGSPD